MTFDINALVIVTFPLEKRTKMGMRKNQVRIPRRVQPSEVTGARKNNPRIITRAVPRIITRAVPRSTEKYYPTRRRW